jgi:hypothetical protein
VGTPNLTLEGAAGLIRLLEADQTLAWEIAAAILGAVASIITVSHPLRPLIFLQRISIMLSSISHPSSRIRPLESALSNPQPDQSSAACEAYEVGP